MKKVLMLLFAAIILVACDNGQDHESKSTKELPEIEKEREVINEQDHDLILIENEDIVIKLLTSEHIRIKDKHDELDIVSMEIGIDNKQNKTVNVSPNDISIDGQSENMNLGFSDGEVKSNESVIATLSLSKDVLSDNKHLSFDEHISGEFVYYYYDDSRYEVSFNQYIND